MIVTAQVGRQNPAYGLLHFFFPQEPVV